MKEVSNHANHLLESNTFMTSPRCPNCGKNDKTYKVSLLYVECSARLSQREVGQQNELVALLVDQQMDQANSITQRQHLNHLIRSFSPPSGEQRFTRRIHPDLMVVGFGAIAVALLYQIAKTQPGAFPYAAILLAASLLAYGLFRKVLVRKFEAQTNKEHLEKDQVEQAISRWMKLYFCSRDQGVFIPGQNELVSIEQMNELVFDQEAHS